LFTVISRAFEPVLPKEGSLPPPRCPRMDDLVVRRAGPSRHGANHSQRLRYLFRGRSGVEPWRFGSGTGDIDLVVRMLSCPKHVGMNWRRSSCRCNHPQDIFAAATHDELDMTSSARSCSISAKAIHACDAGQQCGLSRQVNYLATSIRNRPPGLKTQRKRLDRR